MVAESAVVVELEDDGLQGLTSAQQLFARLVFSGLDSTEAYRRAYDAGDRTPTALYSAAWATLHNPKVQAKLTELRRQAESQTSLAPILNREWVRDGIRKIAETGDKDSTRLAAYVALGKTREINLFGSDPEPAAKPQTTEDMDRRILELMRGMVTSIDGSARDITPGSPGSKAPASSPAAATRKRKPKR